MMSIRGSPPMKLIGGASGGALGERSMWPVQLAVCGRGDCMSRRRERGCWATSRQRRAHVRRIVRRGGHHCLSRHPDHGPASWPCVGQGEPAQVAAAAARGAGWSTQVGVVETLAAHRTCTAQGQRLFADHVDSIDEEQRQSPSFSWLA